MPREAVRPAGRRARLARAPPGAGRPPLWRKRPPRRRGPVRRCRAAVSAAGYAAGALSERAQTQHRHRRPSAAHLGAGRRRDAGLRERPAIQDEDNPLDRTRTDQSARSVPHRHGRARDLGGGTRSFRRPPAARQRRNARYMIARTRRPVGSAFTRFAGQARRETMKTDIRMAIVIAIAAAAMTPGRTAAEVTLNSVRVGAEDTVALAK